MCGIVGYTGKGKASEIILDCLKRLEYRGYDSCGMAISNGNGTLQLRKNEGRISVLEEQVLSSPPEGSSGIGHTRWATHGQPSFVNAHPHCDSKSRLAVVHNGIIENYEKIRNELQKSEYVFQSETDTESIVHLIAYHLEKDAHNLLNAVRKTMPLLTGDYALCVMDAQDPGTIVAVRKGAPLIVGVGENGNFVTSDVASLLPYTRRVIYLKDGEVAVIGSDNIRFFNSAGTEKPPEIQEICWSVEQAEKMGYETYMLKEIHEQPEALRRTWHSLVPKSGLILEHEGERLDNSMLRKLDRIYLISCGTAYHACMAGKYLLDIMTDLDIQTDYASEFRYRRLKLDRNKLFLAVSQSGETADTLASLRIAKSLGSTVMSVVNVRESTIARESDYVIYTLAGPEIGVASTKAYTSQLMALSMLAVSLGHVRGDMTDEKKDYYLSELKRIPDKLELVLEKEEEIRKYAEEVAEAQGSFYLGRGFNFPTALEGALKNKEISYMHCEGYSGGEMKHGPIALIRNGFPIISVCTNGATYGKMVSNIREVKARGAFVITIASEGDSFLKTVSDRVLYVPKTIEEFSPVINIVVLQILAYYIARYRGCDIDKPRNLAKSVTVE